MLETNSVKNLKKWIMNGGSVDDEDIKFIKKNAIFFKNLRFRKKSNEVEHKSSV